VGKEKNNLGRINITIPAEIKKRRRHGKRYAKGGHTRVAVDVRKGIRKPPPVPNKDLKEIIAMDEHDEAFRHGATGHPRRWHNIDGTVKEEPVSWKDKVRAYRQSKTNDRRARVRKHEAEVVVASKVLKTQRKAQLDGQKIDIYDEDRLIAEAILNLDEWDNEELIRGYRRNRNGKFGVAPKYIPREIQQEAFRRLVARGERTLKGAYVKSIQELVDLAQNAGSEKVKLDAIKTVIERVSGKVPDKVLVAREEPWEGILADAIVPLSETPPLELIPGDDGVYAMEPLAESEGEVETSPSPDAARGPRTKGPKAPSPSQSRRRRSSSKASDG
jgi:hypothetical protein